MKKFSLIIVTIIFIQMMLLSGCSIKAETMLTSDQTESNSSEPSAKPTPSLKIYGPVVPDGEGTEEKPFIIKNIGNLNWITINNVNYNNFNNKYFEQTENITIEGKWIPIGIVPPEMTEYTYEQNYFSGKYDGKGFVIDAKKAVIDDFDTYGSHAGIFSELSSSGVVKNLGVIVDREKVSYSYDGGLVGENWGTLSSCYVVGNITGGSEWSGGLAGGNGGIITDCYAICNVLKGGGGLVGENYANGKIVNCYASGNIGSGGYSGGLVGCNYQGTITNCFATGNVGTGGKSGGLAGSSSSGYIINCYYVDDKGTDGIGQGFNDQIYQCKLEANINYYKNISTYMTISNWNSTYPWNFSSIWGISNEINDGYPYLHKIS